MCLSFDHGGFNYQAIEVTSSMVSKKVVCVDSVFFNEHAPTRNRFMEPPVGTRSAFQRTVFSEYVTKKDREEASKFPDNLVNRTDGFFLPNITHRWFNRIAMMMAQNKLVYTTLSNQRAKLYVLRRYPLN